MSTEAHSWRPGTIAAAATLIALLWLNVWPLSANPSGLSFNYNDDAMLHTWIISWVSRQLVMNPTELLDGNMYYPAEHSLTYADSMLAPAAMGVPFYWLTADPVLTHNAVWLLGFLLSALAMFALVLRLTGDRWAAVLSALLFVVNAQAATRYPHVMAVHQEWIPLSLLGLHSLMERARIRDAFLLGIGVAGAALTSGYLVSYLVVLLAVVLAATVRLWLHRRPRRLMGLLGLAMALSLALALPLIYPWLEASVEARAGQKFATALSFLTPSSTLHLLWGSDLWRRTNGIALFPGVAPLILAVVALATTRAEGSGTRWVLVRAYWLVGIVGIILALGPATLLFRLAGMMFPPLLALRAGSRLGILMLIAVAVLAGYGLAAIRRRLSPARSAGLTLLLVLICNAEVYSMPHVEPVTEPPRIYERVAQAGERTVLIEFPYHSVAGTRHLDAEYVLNSTSHWKKLVNGYGSYVPLPQQKIGAPLSQFPNERSVHLLRRLRVTHVLIHFNHYSAEEATQIRTFLSGRKEFRRIATDADGRVLYRFRRRRF